MRYHRVRSPALVRVAARTALLYWCVLSLTFVLLRLAPGDPATFLLPPGASAADAGRLRTELELDRPIAVQYARWAGRTLRADLGRSFVDERPVTAVIGDALPVSLALGGASLLLSFLVGAVVAFLGATVLRDFGASVFTVELVGYSFLREFGVLLTAILIAGRSGSAFTAQIGSMKAGEEIDAIRTLGLNPVEVLVLPRALALLISMPLLTFIAMVAGLLGGMSVGAFSLDIPPQAYLARMQSTIELRHFLVGMSKAPIFALVIGLIGCLEGLQVQGTAQSVGERTTSSVVQTISLVIVLDAIAAIWFMHMGW